MQHTISISQTAIYTNFPTLDLKDAAIIDFICKFTAKPKIKTKIEDGQIFYWIQYQNLVAQNPLLKIKEQCLRKRIAYMCDLQIFEAHPNNQSSGQTFFAYGERIEDVHFSKDPESVGKFLPTVSEGDGTGIPTATVQEYQRVGKIIPTEQGINNNSKITIHNSSIYQDEKIEIEKNEAETVVEPEPVKFRDDNKTYSPPKQKSGGIGQKSKLMTMPELAKKIAQKLRMAGIGLDKFDAAEIIENHLSPWYNITSSPYAFDNAYKEILDKRQKLFGGASKAPQNGNKVPNAAPAATVEISPEAKQVGEIFNNALSLPNWKKVQTQLDAGFIFGEIKQAYVDTPETFDPFNYALSEHGLMSARRKLAQAAAQPEVEKVEAPTIYVPLLKAPPGFYTPTKPSPTVDEILTRGFDLAKWEAAQLVEKRVVPTEDEKAAKRALLQERQALARAGKLTFE